MYQDDHMEKVKLSPYFIECTKINSNLIIEV